MKKLPADIQPAFVPALIDTREITPLRLYPMRAERATLPFGDYSVRFLEHVIAIERKSLPDLLACVGVERPRFEKHIRGLLGYQIRALVVEASWSEIEQGDWRSQVTSAAVIGSLTSWQISGLPVILAETHERAGRIVSRMLFQAARKYWSTSRALIHHIAGQAEQDAKSKEANDGAS